MVIWEFLDSPNLIRTQAFYVYEITKIVVINKNKKFVFATF